MASALELLCDSGLVFRRGHPPEAKFLFKHALVQDAAYGSLLRADRRDVHRKIAEALEAHFSEIDGNLSPNCWRITSRKRIWPSPLSDIG